VNVAHSYDLVARWYDVDMARNMAYDDVGFYRGLALECGGRVLELGCGNGRILLELLSAGCDAFGVDRSAGMLASLVEKARERGLRTPVAQMDVRALGLVPGAALVLCPYSLVTYMADDEDGARLCAEARRVLRRGGSLVLDAFVPRGEVASGEFREDYRRAFDSGALTRARRVTALAGGRNRIERRYAWSDAAGVVREEAQTCEVIRPYTPDALRAMLAQRGFVVTDVWWDYGARAGPEGAQFVTMRAYFG
jgi:SAM-dependent methyltransferase